MGPPPGSEGSERIRSVMSGCYRPNGSSYYRPGIDDWASANHLYETNSSFVPGGGLESARSLFARSGSTTEDTAEYWRSVRSVRISGSSSVAQRVRMTEPSSSQLTYSVRSKTNSSSAAFKARFHRVDQPILTTMGGCPGTPAWSDRDSGAAYEWINLFSGELSPAADWTLKSVTSSISNLDFWGRALHRDRSF